MRVRKMFGAAVLAVSVVLGGSTVGASVVQAAPVVAAAPTVLAGQFCKQADLGKVVTADNGKTVKCTRVDGYNRWVIK